MLTMAFGQVAGGAQELALPKVKTPLLDATQP